MSNKDESCVSGEIDSQLIDKKVDEQEQFLVKGGVQSYRTMSIRWFALVLACMLMVGNYMSYDFPTYLQQAIGQSVFDCPKYSDKTPECESYNNYYPWLYSIYSLPNFILPLFGGFFIDKIGVRTGLVVFTAIIMAGQLVCTLAGLFSGGWDHPTTVFVWFYIGRFIFALGGENQTVTQSTIVSKWFVGKELAFALGTNISCARLGSVAGGFMFPAVYKSANNQLTVPLLVAECFCIASFLFMLGLVYMDRKADQQEGKEDNKLDDSEQVSLRDIGKFPALYWLLSFSCLFNYQGIFIFLQFGNDFLQYKYQDGEVEAGQMLTIPYLISAALTPFIGILADKIGQRQWLLLGSSCVMTLAHVLWLVFPDCPESDTEFVPVCSKAYQVIPLVLMGLFYACYAAILWPCVPLVLKENLVGTGFGVATAIQNFGLFLSPLLVSAIIKGTKSNDGGYFWSEIFFVGVGIVCILLSFAIIVINGREGNKLGRVLTKEQLKKQSRASRVGSFAHH